MTTLGPRIFSFWVRNPCARGYSHPHKTLILVYFSVRVAIATRTCAWLSHAHVYSVQIRHLDVFILHTKREKFPTIFISCENLLKRFNLTWFFLYFCLHHFLNQKPKRRTFIYFTHFFNEICPKLWNLISYDKIKGFLKKELLALIFFHDLWVDFKKWVQGKIGENQYV